MKKLCLLVLCCTLFLTSCEGAPQPKKYEKDSPQDRISQYIEDLTAKEMEGRRAGTGGEIKASLYLADLFQQAGLKPGGEQETYFQTFTIGHYEPITQKKRMTFQARMGEAKQAENILGILPGKEPGYIVVSAHYDHLGIIDKKLYPGANDNASGVAVILELINQLKVRRPTYSIIFALWSAEEMGLLGSDYYCSHPTVPLDSIKAIVNLDSVGYLEDKKQLLGWSAKESGTSNELLSLLEKSGWQIKWEGQSGHNSDHASFNKRGIGGFTLLSPDWLNRNHTPKDEIRRIEINPLAELVEALKNALLTIGR